MSESVKTPASNLIDYIEKQLKRLTGKLDKALGSGDSEAVHDLRVASRRLTSPLCIVAEFIGDKRIKRINRGLKTLRQAFRKTRDLDVVQASLVATQSPTLDATSLARLEGFLTRKRERSIRKARKVAQRVDVKSLESDARTAVDQFQDNLDLAAESTILTIAQQAMDQWSVRLAQHDPRNPDIQNLHETRLCVKRLRYAAELQRDLQGRGEDKLISALAEVQELLGQWNDHLVAAAKAGRLASKASLRGEDPGWAASLLSYASSRAEQAVALRERIVEAWPTVIEAQAAAEPSAEAPEMIPGGAQG